MINVQEELKARGLTSESYRRLLDECDKKLNGYSDKDWVEISEEFNLGWSGDTLRKACQPPLVGSMFVKHFYEQTPKEEVASVDLEERKRELEQLKVQYRDERNAWAKQNREYARNEKNWEMLAQSLHEDGEKRYPLPEFKPWQSFDEEKEMIVLLSDMHIGQSYDNAFGKYNSDLAQKRLDYFGDSIIDYADKMNIGKIKIISLGDQINGNIHTSIAITNRENVVEQIKVATRLISDFCWKMAMRFDEVDFYSVNGNHSRITKNKDDEIRNERLDNMISWIVSEKLSYIPNFMYHPEAEMENGLIKFDSFGKEYLAVHGDLDRNTETGISSLCFMTQSFPEAIFRGHLHTPAYNLVNGVQIIQSGSLGGSGDDYTVSKRLSGYPSQTFVVTSANGIESIHHVRLDRGDVDGGNP